MPPRHSRAGCCGHEFVGAVGVWQPAADGCEPVLIDEQAVDARQKEEGREVEHVTVRTVWNNERVEGGFDMDDPSKSPHIRLKSRFFGDRDTPRVCLSAPNRRG